MNDFPKLWELYPHIWPTKAKFFAWLRGGLRRGLWEKYPPKLELKNKLCTKPPEGYAGRAKSGTICALTGEWVGKSKLEVDHLVGHVSLNDWEDLLPFILHLLATDDKMQLVDKEAHKIKSYAERQGISFKEALCEKEVIKACKKSAKEQTQELLSLGYSEQEVSNGTKRRDCWREYFSRTK